MGHARPPIAPGLLAGLGLGGFLDGIFFHQVLQWHHLTSQRRATDTVSGLEANVVADGLFHVATLALVAAALWVTYGAWRNGRLAPPWRLHVGLVIAGWGAFNLLDALVFHLLLGAHYLRDDLGAPLGWELGYLAFGTLLLGGGLLLARRGERRPLSRPRAPSRAPRPRGA